MNPIQHFEIPADDFNRAKKFYNNLFGWKFEGFDSEDKTFHYDSITIDSEDGKGLLNGGLHKRQDSSSQIIIYITVSSLDGYSNKIKENGGEILVPKTAVPKMGYFAHCKDTENNVFGIWETNDNA